MDNSYSQEFRLKTPEDFNNLKLNPRFKSSTYLNVYFKDNGLEFSRLGLAVKKSFGHAPLRNWIKRHIREEFRRSGIKHKSVDYLFSFKSKGRLTKVQLEEVKLDISSIFKRLEN